VEVYRRLVASGRTSTTDRFLDELEDRFGEPPTPVLQLVQVERLKYSAAGAGLESVAMRGDELLLKAYPGEERALSEAGRFSAERGYVEDRGIYTEEATKTLYMKLRFEDVNKRQELLLKWLNSIIDDIMKTCQPSR